ncbi:hypothetical protein [Teredinibacter turnerae]|uniref:hypothetical protein n=1 Tax=Teredinibacter turnerae TaxID=2426 RepID=UPI0003821F2A|nr:hypothetical protein [Teredinibacter turnerae]
MDTASRLDEFAFVPIIILVVIGFLLVVSLLFCWVAHSKICKRLLGEEMPSKEDCLGNSEASIQCSLARLNFYTEQAKAYQSLFSIKSNCALVGAIVSVVFGVSFVCFVSLMAWFGSSGVYALGDAAVCFICALSVGVCVFSANACFRAYKAAMTQIGRYARQPDINAHLLSLRVMLEQVQLDTQVKSGLYEKIFKSVLAIVEKSNAADDL